MFEPSIIFVRIPKVTWESYPADRSFAAAVEDLTGMERKIEKGVQVSLESFRYHHLSVLVEARALEAITERKLQHLVISQNEYHLYRRVMFKLFWHRSNEISLTISVAPLERLQKAERTEIEQFKRNAFWLLLRCGPFKIFQTYQELRQGYQKILATHKAVRQDRAEKLRLTEPVFGVSDISVTECRKLCGETIFVPGKPVAMLQRMLEVVPHSEGFAIEFSGADRVAAMRWLGGMKTFLDAAVAEGDAVFVLYQNSLMVQKG